MHPSAVSSASHAQIQELGVWLLLRKVILHTVLAPAGSEKLGEVFDGGLCDMRKGLLRQERLVAGHDDIRKSEQAREDVIRDAFEEWSSKKSAVSSS
jgi:hypothetical protein